MVVTIIFPKPQYYFGKDVNTQRIYRATFKKYIELLVKHNCTIEYFLEDEIAKTLLEELNVKDVKCISCLAPSDVLFSKQYPTLFELPEYIHQEYDYVQKFNYDVEQRYMVPHALLRESKEAYLQKRAEIARKRLRIATDRYLSYRSHVLQVRANNNIDRTTPIRDTIEMGDGRLCIEVSPDSNVCTTYYGGVFIPEDMLDSVLSI